MRLVWEEEGNQSWQDLPERSLYLQGLCLQRGGFHLREIRLSSLQGTPQVKIYIVSAVPLSVCCDVD